MKSRQLASLALVRQESHKKVQAFLKSRKNMYRACRWTTSASRAIYDSSRRSNEKLFGKQHGNLLEFRRNNAVSAGVKLIPLLKFLGSGVIATGATIGVGIFYAGRDDKVRLQIEDTIPQSKKVLNAIYGDHEKKGSSDDEAESLLPLNRKLQQITEPANDQEKPLEMLDEKVDIKEAKPNIDIEKKKAARDNVVVITTIDDQAAVSSVDLDIGNSTSQREKVKKPKKEKPKKEKKEKKKKVKSEEEKKETPAEPEIVEKSESTLTAVTVSEVATEVLEQKDEQTVVTDSETVTSATQPAIQTEGEQAKTTVTTSDQMMSEISIPTIEPEQIVMEEELTKEEIERLSEIIDNTSLEVLLQTYVDKLQLLKDMAIEKQAKASGQIKEYIAQLDKAVKIGTDEESFDEVWKNASDLEQKSQASIDEAKDLEMKMQAGIEEVHEMIQAAKRKGESQIADAAQEMISKASIELQKATDNVKKACEELSFLDMADISKAVKEDVKEQLTDAFPELLDTSKDDSENKLPVKDVMVAYAMKKIEHLKDVIESVKKEEKERTDALLQSAREEEEARTQARLQSEAERLQKNFEVESEKKEAELSSYYEGEIKKQLKRQSAAHREHLNDVLQTQAVQLASEHQESLEKELSKQKQVHVEELTRVAAHLKGVESMIDSVVDVETKNRKTRELWLAVQSLSSVLSEDAEDGRTRNLLPEVMSIHKLSENHPKVQLVLSTVPESALVQGVSTEEELRKRFASVKNICKRVAMVGEKEGSLWTYALSAIRSFLVIETAARHDISKDIDPENISTYDILAKSQTCIDNGDLELAVKFMSLLKGAPRKLASDWLRESRSYLEAKLASDFLLAYVSSEGAFQN